jgi:hypothetical protein
MDSRGWDALREKGSGGKKREEDGGLIREEDIRISGEGDNRSLPAQFSDGQ